VRDSRFDEARISSRFVARRELVFCGGRKFHPHVAARRGKKMRKRNFTMTLPQPEYLYHLELTLLAGTAVILLALYSIELIIKKVLDIVRLCRKGWTDAA
jgi:hypothetical protein